MLNIDKYFLSTGTVYKWEYHPFVFCLHLNNSCVRGRFAHLGDIVRFTGQFARVTQYMMILYKNSVLGKMRNRNI